MDSGRSILTSTFHVVMFECILDAPSKHLPCIHIWMHFGCTFQAPSMYSNLIAFWTHLPSTFQNAFKHEYMEGAGRDKAKLCRAGVDL